MGGETQDNLGRAFVAVGLHKKDIGNLEKAIAIYQGAIGVIANSNNSSMLDRLNHDLAEAQNFLTQIDTPSSYRLPPPSTAIAASACSVIVHSPRPVVS